MECRLKKPIAYVTCVRLIFSKFMILSNKYLLINDLEWYGMEQGRPHVKGMARQYVPFNFYNSKK